MTSRSCGSFLTAVAVLLPLAGWSSAHATSSFTTCLRAHLARYPRAQAEDVYKFAHQSVFGPGHAVPSLDEARRYVVEEVAALAPGPPGEPLYDRLSDDPPLVRLNLRPYVAGGGDVGALVAAFAATAARVHGSAEVMRQRLQTAVEVLRETGRVATADRLATLAAEQEVRGFPAGHHSAAYTAAYAPAYRVVDPELLSAQIAAVERRRPGQGPAASH